MSVYECVNINGCTNRQEPGCGLGGCKDRKPSQDDKQVTQEMLNAAMKEAVRLGIFPKESSMGNYVKHWEGMESVLKAAMKA